jgi:hypothetical protein
VVAGAERDGAEVDMRVDQGEEPAVEVGRVALVVAAIARERADEGVHGADGLLRRLAVAEADVAAHEAVPAMLGRVAVVAALHLDDEEAALWVDDDEVEFARADGVGILHEEVLDDDPGLVRQRVLEALAHDELGLVRGALVALAADLVGNDREEGRHAGSKCRNGAWHVP